MEYTKGEWKIYKSSDNVSERVPPEGRGYLWNIWIVDEDDKAIAQIHSNDDDKLKANAQLIASAPELYEALKNAKIYFASLSVTKRITISPLISYTEQALAKAEGK